MKSNGLDKEISDRLDSKIWSAKICDAVYKRRRWKFIQLGLAVFFSAFFSCSLVWMTFFEKEGAIARNELQNWVQEQIYGTAFEAETTAKSVFSQEEETARNMLPGPPPFDVDTLIEASLDRR
ncbi:hypothetical protein EHQ12_12965 [Leptospira gomenensis]|uniref:Uncharacterized protein n=1 Tax=Leptospira gomenensis TaxID=2484974 RepID=A0A5F1Y653_9LEPT|nr:hypothetical protein [Leptospira gomenensis]TGK28163.1 hypothetical protein EHQ17_19000 [Leptospira gomenensis]TGK36983.1 hypothetical protein EHQ12_12965 [Leptospira gomenensis]TGK45619.1 hypothetical protein EHQ07_07980 [Leptospira gomenensis]TGK59558.1 hypothetical protein EHQ13_12190 [Leptospira gomenensis]